MSEEYDFDELIDRSESGCVKWDKYRGRDILPMWIADTDFAVMPEIRQALLERLEHPIYGYTQPPERLFELVAGRMRERYGWQVEPGWVVPLPSMICAFYLACRATGEAGDPVYLPEVIYPPFTRAAGLNAMVNRPVPVCRRDGRMILDLDWLDSQPMRPGRLLLFCNPHNPGGAVYRRDELERLADIVERHDMVLCSDEIHCDLVLEGENGHIPIASLNPRVAERSITLISPSKTFNLPGLGCAFAIVPDRDLRRRMTTNPFIVPHVNIMGLVAAEAAYRYGDDWNRQLCAYLAANRDYLLAEINRIPGLRLGPVEATYLAWIDVSALRLDNPPRFFEDAGVGMSPGSEFGDAGFMRLNFGCPRSRVEEAVKRIRRAVEAVV
jgi:cystathionine beta-lyase